MAKVPIPGAKHKQHSTSEKNFHPHLIWSQRRLQPAMALRIPTRFLQVKRRDLAHELRQADDIHYVLLSRNGSDTNRFPREGWAKGTVSDVAMALQLGATPNSKIQEAAALLEYRINQAALLLEASIATRPSIGHSNR